MANLKELKTQVENANALGVANLIEKGVELPANATTYEIMQKIAEVSGSGSEYTNIVFDGYNQVVFTDKDGNSLPMHLEYEDGKITSVVFGGKEVATAYEGDKLIQIGNTDIDLSNRYPTDYVLYVPLTEESATAETGQELVKTGTDYTFQTVDGVPCIKMNNSYMVTYTNALINKDYTLSAWGKLPTIPSYNVSLYGIGAYENSSTPYTTIGVEHNEKTWFLWDNLSQKAMYSDIPPTLWHHLLLVHKSGILTLYIDGTSVFSFSATQNFTSDNEEIQIGKGFVNSSTYSFGGYMSAFRVYDRALSEEEITLLASEFEPTDRQVV